MRKIAVLNGSDALIESFAKCCGEHEAVDIAVAWCGNPSQVLPFKYLEDFKGKITATIGYSFNHTHPDSFEWLDRIGAEYRLFKDGADLYHPKIYLFTTDKHFALFLGSSNLTYGGFCSNVEVNALLEGDLRAPENRDVADLRKQLSEWHSSAFSFKPKDDWIAKYREDYLKATKLAKRQGVRTPAQKEEEIGAASWLGKASWSIYYGKVLDGLKRQERDGRGYHEVLDAAATLVHLPWRSKVFQDPEKRRVIGGLGEYGWLGHVGASGQFRHLIAKGASRDLAKVVKCVNAAGEFNPPIPWKELESILGALIGLGFTMKVWGRLLCITRPDLYCTVASESVRTNLSAALKIPKNAFEKPEGYIKLLRLIHSSPWFNSDKPKQTEQVDIWNRRSAFMDAIFY